MSLAEMLAALNKSSGIAWRLGDSERHGDYLSARLGDERTRLRLFTSAEQFVLDIRWNRSATGAMSRAEVEAIVQHEVLARIGAHSVTPRESWD